MKTGCTSSILDSVEALAIPTLAHMKEPPSKENPLLSLDNVIVTPHMGADSQETLKNMDLVAVKNILRVLRGEIPLYALNFPFTQSRHRSKAQDLPILSFSRQNSKHIPTNNPNIESNLFISKFSK